MLLFQAFSTKIHTTYAHIGKLHRFKVRMMKVKGKCVLSSFFNACIVCTLSFCWQRMQLTHSELYVCVFISWSSHYTHNSVAVICIGIMICLSIGSYTCTYPPRPPASSSLNSHRRSHSESDVKRASSKPKKERSISTEGTDSPVLEDKPPNDRDPPEVNITVSFSACNPQISDFQTCYI